MELEVLIELVYDELLITAEDIIDYSYILTHYHTHKHARGKTKDPYEPDFIACLVKHCIPKLAIEWGDLLKRYGISLSLATVFCHGSPIVDTNQKPNPELGDLLIVHIHHPAKGKARRRAVLLQAKMTEKSTSKISSGDEHQLTLYSKWPVFKYKSGKLKGQQRDVRPKGAHDGGRYLLISKTRPYPSSPPSYFLTAKAKELLVYDHTLATELTKMLLLEKGRVFNSRNGAMKGIGWSRVVWDLLELGFQNKIQRSRSGHKKTDDKIQGDTQKIRSEIFQYTTLPSDGSYPSILDYFNDGDSPNKEPNIDENDDGISIILIETYDSGIPDNPDLVMNSTI